MTTHAIAIPNLSSTRYGQWSKSMESEMSIVTKIESESEYIMDGDVIMIFTANHSYEFTVTDGQARRGLLRGGTLGEQQFTAISSSSIQEGYGAGFEVELHSRLCRLMTSDVTSLICIRERERTKKEILKFSSA